jgi:hypothetical protein
MKAHHIEWKHLDRNGRTCDRCGDTGATLRAVVSELNTHCGGRGVHFHLTETRLGPDRLTESNVILVDGAPLESVIGAQLTETECNSCGELLGEPTRCRAIVADGALHEAIPAELVRAALCQAAACCGEGCACDGSCN